MRLCYSRKLTRARPCVFEKRYATALDLNLEDGEPLRMRSVNGAFVVYGYELTIRVLDIEHTAIVYFYADDNFGRKRPWPPRMARPRPPRHRRP